ncbi:hypothetical protein [Arthrobacter cupressi]|uniref:Uncharacterized protein n=1 Tax=Arthrobacter cupressi TaxID=1045773 RepID=A0A1G8WST3_9MICC|nr:hypothetical protein [Arthrobacter cupressi]NYD79889.1 hypothetical protein [Arthrobacter cupressi]SDJ81408.1 hypothetical protein SAMN05216555_11743 [Arthrobacter cupressi]
MAFPITVRAGLLFPEETLQADWFAVLATFVAINTLMYGALAIAKILPKLHPGDWLRTRNQRSETRSICPAAPVVDARDFRAAHSGRSRGSG